MSLLIYIPSNMQPIPRLRETELKELLQLVSQTVDDYITEDYEPFSGHVVATYDDPSIVDIEVHVTDNYRDLYGAVHHNDYISFAKWAKENKIAIIDMVKDTLAAH